MKKIILSLCLCICLTACETVDSLEWPSLQELNPFGDNGEVQEVVIEENRTIAEETPLTPVETDRQPVETVIGQTDQAARTTEMEEMARVMGFAPQAAPGDESAPAAASIEDFDIEQALNDIFLADFASVQVQDKPNLAAALKQSDSPTPSSKPRIMRDPDADDSPAEIADKIREPIQMMQPETVPQPQPQTMPETTADVAQEGDQIAISGCPVIEIMPAARSMTYFEQEMSGDMLARAVMTDIRGGCELTDKGLEIDLDILMKGTITDKGRFEGKRDQEAFMTFPYFVSIITPNGKPMNKKIVATAMRFRPSVNHLDHAEKITQLIPMSNPAQADKYKIVLGYQLSRKQLEYNRAQDLLKPDNKRVAPDLVNQPRISVDPLKESE